MAFYLDHFFDKLRREYIEYKFKKPKKVELRDVCRHIAAHLNYARAPKPIYDFVLRQKRRIQMTPVKVDIEFVAD